MNFSWQGAVAVVLALAVGVSVTALALGAVYQEKGVSPQGATVLNTALGAVIGAVAAFLGGRVGESGSSTTPPVREAPVRPAPIPAPAPAPSPVPPAPPWTTRQRSTRWTTRPRGTGRGDPLRTAVRPTIRRCRSSRSRTTSWSAPAARCPPRPPRSSPRDRAVLVDPAWLPDELDAIADELAERGLRVTAGFSTHAHHDHLLWHPRYGDAPRWASAGTARMARDHSGELLEHLGPGYPDEVVARFGAVAALAGDELPEPFGVDGAERALRGRRARRSRAGSCRDLVGRTRRAGLRRHAQRHRAAAAVLAG